MSTVGFEGLRSMSARSLRLALSLIPSCASPPLFIFRSLHANQPRVRSSRTRPSHFTQGDTHGQTRRRTPRKSCGTSRTNWPLIIIARLLLITNRVIITSLLTTLMWPKPTLITLSTAARKPRRLTANSPKPPQTNLLRPSRIRSVLPNLQALPLPSVLGARFIVPLRPHLLGGPGPPPNNLAVPSVASSTLGTIP